MKLNEPSSEQSVPTKSNAIAQQSTPLHKAQRYLGLFAVVWLAYFLLSPRSNFRVLGFSYANPRPYIMNENYHHETVLSNIIIAVNQEDAWEVESAGEFLAGCETAKQSVATGGRSLTEESLATSIERLPAHERKRAAKVILDACTPPFLGSSKYHERAEQIEPKYWDLLQKYQKLRNEARTEQGLEGVQTPVPTSEMALISERLEEIRKPLVLQAANHLLLKNNLAHIAVVALVVFGIWFRGTVGRVILAPFSWVFSSAKKVHEKI